MCLEYVLEVCIGVVFVSLNTYRLEFTMHEDFINECTLLGVSRFSVILNDVGLYTG